MLTCSQALLLEAVEREPLPVPWIAQEPAKAGAEATHLLKHPTPKQLSLPIPPIDPSRLPPSSSPAPQETIKVPPTSPLSPAPSADEEEELEPPPYGAEDCFAALRALARLHAPFLGNDSLLDTLSSAHPFLTSDFTDSASAPSLSSRDADHLRERYAALPTSLIPTKEREWLYALIADAPSWREDCSSALASTLLHGDAHMANFLSQSNDIVILCSPQFAIGPPTLDLAYFLTALWASCLGAPPIDAAQALEAYLTELARLGVAWLRSESEEDLTAKAELLGRCVQLEAAVTILWRTIEYVRIRCAPFWQTAAAYIAQLERTPDIASERIDAVLNHLRDLEPRCRETSALLAHRAEKEERQEHAVV